MVPRTVAHCLQSNRSQFLEPSVIVQNSGNIYWYKFRVLVLGCTSVQKVQVGSMLTQFLPPHECAHPPILLLSPEPECERHLKSQLDLTWHHVSFSPLLSASFYPPRLLTTCLAGLPRSLARRSDSHLQQMLSWVSWVWVPTLAPGSKPGAHGQHPDVGLRSADV